jgi:hypothetical protein
MLPTSYYMISNEMLVLFREFLSTNEALLFMVGVAFVTGFAIGVGIIMKRIKDANKESE